MLFTKYSKLLWVAAGQFDKMDPETLSALYADTQKNKCLKFSKESLKSIRRPTRSKTRSSKTKEMARDTRLPLKQLVLPKTKRQTRTDPYALDPDEQDLNLGALESDLFLHPDHRLRYLRSDDSRRHHQIRDMVSSLPLHNNPRPPTMKNINSNPNKVEVSRNERLYRVVVSRKERRR
jgi:hypothetical protein